MKKYLLALLTLGVCLGVARADNEVGLPKSQRGETIQIPGFMGVSYATSSFSAEIATVTISTNTVFGPTTVFGVEFSSGLCSSYDFMDVFDSSSMGTIPANGANNAGARFRWYNVSGSTAAGSATGGLSCSGWSGPQYPIRLKYGAFFKPSVATYNSIRLYYWKDGQ